MIQSAGMSHKDTGNFRLNQPLAAIRAASDNALKFLGRGNVTQASDNLSLIIRLTERIAAITGELLSFGRRGRGEVTLVPIDEIIDGAMLLVADSYRRCNVQLQVTLAQPLPSIRAGRIRIEQVLVNLLQNALDAVRDYPDPRVELKVVARAQQLVISVADNGPGVPADLVETIFQPFYTGRQDGTGLGLGISREITMDHGGTLTVEPNGCGGATFVVMLPIAEEKQA